MKKRSKRYAQNQKILPDGGVSIDVAVTTLQAMAGAGFDESVELALHLGVDPKQGDQMVRGIVKLPHGSGKTVRVVAFTDDVDGALAAGADHAGLEDLVARIRDDGWCDFDVAVAKPEAMTAIRPIAKILGPRGLMPSPKAGTVAEDIGVAIRDVKAGRCEFKMDKTANVALVVGKRSFDARMLQENIRATLTEVVRSKPQAVRERFVRSATLSSTMGPGIVLDLRELQA
ncbi:MAG: 50S ribosomal protein L1 [Puniceicoccales bacterium]|jgi:large subunit ribosomal protein L1|nr:50S ribosomal protein L1 [Puniceicoccales bacterium]